MRGTCAEIKTQDEGRYAQGYITLYLLFFLFLIIVAVIAFCKLGGAEASKRWLYLTVQLVNFTVLLGVFWLALFLAGGDGFAFFLGKREPGVVSAYEAFFIWLLFLFGAILQILSVMNDKYRKEIRMGVGGILVHHQYFSTEHAQLICVTKGNVHKSVTGDVYQGARSNTSN